MTKKASALKTICLFDCILTGHLEKIDNRNDWYFILHYISFQKVDVLFKEFWISSSCQSFCVLPQLRTTAIDKYCQHFDYINSTDRLTNRFWKKNTFFCKQIMVALKV